MKNAKEIKSACDELSIDSEIIEGSDARDFMERLFNKYNVEKRSGHLAIGLDSLSIPLEKHEFTYSEFLDNEAVFVFFDQESADRNVSVRISNGKMLGGVLENCYGMEYFLTNKSMNYLLAVNWYVIEGVGNAKKWLAKLA